jgi:alcohol dehydrogenase (NADP+)
MEKLVAPGGRVRFIGVSNFNLTQMEDILSIAKVKPKTHQFELHPYLQQREFLDWHHKNNITVTAYAPLGNTSPYYRSGAKEYPILANNSIIQEIAGSRSCSGVQVILAWNLMRNVAVIPKSSRISHQKENLETIEKCKLTDEDVKKIDGMSAKWVRRFNNPCKFSFKPAQPCFRGLSDPDSGL